MTRVRMSMIAATAAVALMTAGCSSTKSTATTTSGAGVAVTTAAPGTSVKVTLGDTKGLDATMTLVATPATVAAGNVTFEVKNTGTIEHEMLVIKTDTPFDKIAVTDAGDPPVSVATGADKIDEADSIGETGSPNLKAGETRTFTVKDMAAGKYALVCNVAKHYGMSMRAPFTVTA